MKIDWLKITEYFYSNRKKITEICWHLFSFLYIKIYLIIIFILNVLNFAFVYYINSIASQNLAILHYNVNLGVNLIGNVSQLYIISLIGLVFTILNLILLINVYKEGKFIIHLLLASLIIINLILLMGVSVLYLINFR